MTQRLDLSYEVHWKGNWHVGSGYSAALADRLVRRRGGRRAGALFVPGSQVKGVLRHQCERLAAGLGCRVVQPHATDEAQQQELVESFKPLSESRLLVDRLFGTRFEGECLFVEDAVAREHKRDTSPLARTAIDRLTGTVREQHLFVTEVAHPTAQPLQGRIRARHPDGVPTQDGDSFPYEYGLLLAGLATLDSLGGDKSIGLGRCEVIVTAATWNGTAIDPAAEVQRCFAEPDWLFLVQMLRGEEE